MIYEYRCTLCEKCIDVEHPMSEVNNLSEETKEKLKCPGFGKCEHINENEQEIAKDIPFVRNYSVSFLKFDSLSPEAKRSLLKKRADIDYKKNIEEKKLAMLKTTEKQLKNIVKPPK